MCREFYKNFLKLGGIRYYIISVSIVYYLHSETRQHLGCRIQIYFKKFFHCKKLSLLFTFKKYLSIWFAVCITVSMAFNSHLPSLDLIAHGIYHRSWPTTHKIRRSAGVNGQKTVETANK